MIYLDSAATSLLKPKSVGKAVYYAVNNFASPGRGTYYAAMRAADKVFECRELACKLFDVEKPEKVVFTLNATHALNIAIKSLASKDSTVLISGYEHNSVTRVLNEIGANVIIAASSLFDEKAAIDAFSKKIKNADLVICNHISNVFGYILPINEIAGLCKRNNVPLIIDASQSAGICDISFSSLGAEFIAMPGHKGIMGPQGTGILLCGDRTKPLLCGGTGSNSIEQTMPEELPDRLEAGTHNVAGIAGLAEGIRYVLSVGAKTIGEYEGHLREAMQYKLEKIPGLEVFSGAKQSGVLSVRHKYIDSEELCSKLGSMGIAARCGLHCSPLAHKTAGTLNTGTVRFSMSPFNTEAQINHVCKVLEQIIRAYSTSRST